MSDKPKKAVLCFKLALESNTLNLIESLFLELNLHSEFTPKDTQSPDLQIKGIMKFLLCRLYFIYVSN